MVGTEKYQPSDFNYWYFTLSTKLEEPGVTHLNGFGGSCVSFEEDGNPKSSPARE